jgi:membrane protein
MTKRSRKAIPPQTANSEAPDALPEITKLGRRDTLERILKKFKQDRASMTAGSLAYHWFLALLPALIAALGVIALIHIGSGTLTRLIDGLKVALPGSAQTIFIDAVHHASSQSSKSSSVVVLIISTAIALWSAIGSMVALQSGLDVAYEVPEDRKFVSARVMALVLMLATVVLGGIGAALIVFGSSIGHGIEGHLGLSHTAFTVVWNVIRWAGTIIAMSVLFSFYYFFAPNRKAPRWQWISVGGLVGTIIFLVASLGFSFYVGKAGSYSSTYGALAGVVILMVWFYLTGVAIMLGGEINAELERQASGKGRRGAHASAGRAAQEQVTSPGAGRGSEPAPVSQAAAPAAAKPAPALPRRRAGLARTLRRSDSPARR